MNLLVPCAGKSSRFQTHVPKYLLSMPDNRLMFACAVAPFLKSAKRILFAVLREHDQMYGASAIIKDLLPASEVLILEQVTRGQAETVYVMSREFGVEGPILVKDPDSFFEPLSDYQAHRNYVSLVNARETRDVKLYNKSFAMINEQGYIVGTAEKAITSEYFSCGGYFFSDAEVFMQSFQQYEKLQASGEYYLSQVIDMMIEQRHVFHPMPCKNYEDWGTHEDWIAYRQRFGTFLIDLDGVVYENGSQYWHPRWGESPVFQDARDKVCELYDQGNYIVLVTSRPERLRTLTEQQLQRDQVKYHQLVMGVHHGKRTVVNDFSNSNPYPAAVAINTLRNSRDYLEKL